MINMIKMELYRMFHTKSAYIILLIMGLCVVFTNYMSFDEYNMDTKALESSSPDAASSYTSSEEAVPNLGLNVTLPTVPGEKVTVFDLFFANVQGKFIALFIVIFTILFSNADLNSGFIKNTAGQVKNRFGLVVAKSAAVVVYTVLTLTVFLLLEVVCAKALFGYLEWGNGGRFLSYFLSQVVLHCAFMIILTAISIILKSNVISMLLGICLCMNLTMILYGMLNLLLQKMGVENFDFMSYTITGKISMLPMDISGGDIRSAMITAAIFIVCALGLAGIVFEKRDV